MTEHEPQQMGDRSRLTRDQEFILEEKVLPTARRWLRIPTLPAHGKKTLAYWGSQ